jgi:glutamine synthetase
MAKRGARSETSATKRGPAGRGGDGAARKQVFDVVRERDVKVVDVKFTDLPGTWQHFTLPVESFDDDAFEEGLGFDGSSIRGWQGISESDMLLMPDPSTAILDPFTEAPTLSLVCEIADPLTRAPYAKDPRGVASGVRLRLHP